MKTHPLEKERQKRGLSREQVARILNVHPMSIYFWETWTKTPTKENLRKMQKEFGLNPIDLLDL